MIMKLLSAIILCLFLTGCSVLSTNVKTNIKDPEGKIWTIESKSDALVQIKKDGVEITVDNRGRMSAFEAIMGIVMTKTDINLGLSNQPGDHD